jgi:hypothetical protein
LEDATNTVNGYVPKSLGKLMDVVVTVMLGKVRPIQLRLFGLSVAVIGQMILG